MKPVVRQFQDSEIARLLATKLATAGGAAETADAGPAAATGKGKKKRKKADKPVDIQYFAIGDDVDVHYRIIEGDKERVQVFSGTVIRKKGSGLTENFTVRRIVQGEGVERIFPFYSPKLLKVLVTRRGKVRRAKLYYLRDRVGKSTKVRERLGEQAEKIKRRGARWEAEFEKRLEVARETARAMKAAAGAEGDGESSE